MASLNPISGTLGMQKAAHLLRRATFGPRLADIQAFSSLTATAAFQQLILPQTIPNPPIDFLTGTDWVYPNTIHSTRFTNTISEFTSSWWIENMRSSGANLTDRMVWFFHTHFPQSVQLPYLGPVPALLWI